MFFREVSAKKNSLNTRYIPARNNQIVCKPEPSVPKDSGTPAATAGLEPGARIPTAAKHMNTAGPVCRKKPLCQERPGQIHPLAGRAGKNAFWIQQIPTSVHSVEQIRI
jgi:hypothetical protein